MSGAEGTTDTHRAPPEGRPRPKADVRIRLSWPSRPSRPADAHPAHRRIMLDAAKRRSVI